VRRLRFALLASVAALITTALALPAAAATSNQPSPASAALANLGNHAVQYQVVTNDGTLTYGFQPAPAKVIPDSASGCNQDVCIQIVGHSNYVNEWNSQAYWDGGYICTFSAFHANGRVFRTGTVVCGRAGVFYTFWSPNRYFPSPTHACNTWYGIPGYPCETIKR
jgi:hypothetical protein